MAAKISLHMPRFARDANGTRTPAAEAAGVWLPALALFAIFWTLYRWTATQYNTFDAVSYANEIGRLYPRTHDLHWLFHPHHLLFNATGYVLWRVSQAFGYIGGPLPVMEAWNATSGALGLVLYYLALRSLLQRSRWIPLLIAAGLGLSFGYWICATDARVNMPSTVLLLAAFWAACRLIQTGDKRLAALAGALSGLAILYHESAGLFLVVGAAAALLAHQEDDLPARAAWKHRWTLAAIYLVSSLALVLIVYAIVGIVALRFHSLGEFRRWSSEYAELGWWWNFEILRNIRLDAYAFRRAAFVEPPGKQGTFHLSGAPTRLLAFYFTALLGWFVAVYAFFVALPLLWRTHIRPLLIVSLIWVIAYALFFTVWSPGYFVFWVPVLIPTGLLLALSLAHYRAGRTGLAVNWILGVWIALYAVVNFMASIGPHQNTQSSPFRRIAMDVRRHTAPGDLIVAAGAGDAAQCEVDIPYFADRDCISIHTMTTRARENAVRSRETIQAKIAQTLAAGNRVYVLDEVLSDKSVLDALHKRHPQIDRAQIQETFRPWRRSIAWESSHGPVWSLEQDSAAVPAP
ncbi:hypothetical protein CCAX7_34590 [Capsulimonas corticalis]|uniref:Uncharacterized protein n=1 Tax=Capsulimonas corticalis TaxID=2219043 RepID=A0A402CY93_9BACT|nr:hypothetical protein [Capsulimonas corticalis]BDI31408.1 hypothetical protein CCAX7_34590 [Capsulimonas corticalis]